MTAQTIILPLDGSARARAALPVARSLAETFGATLRILHVSPEPTPSLAELAARLELPGAPLDSWSIEVRSGDEAAAILELAAATQARLIVMCTHTAPERPTGGLGGTALKVLQRAPCAVVLVPPTLAQGPWRPSRVVLPYDGSASADAAVALAGELARRAGSEMIVLQVGATGAGAQPGRGAMTMPRYLDQPHHEWPSWTGEILDRLACLCPDGKFHAHVMVRGGEPAREILDFAADESADLIVLSWKGVWIGDRARTLKTLLRDASCPVLVTRAEPPAAA